MTGPSTPYCLRCFAALPPTDGVRRGAKCPECGRRDSSADRNRYRSLHPDDVRRDRIARVTWAVASLALFGLAVLGQALLLAALVAALSAFSGAVILPGPWTRRRGPAQARATANRLLGGVTLFVAAGHFGLALAGPASAADWWWAAGYLAIALLLLSPGQARVDAWYDRRIDRIDPTQSRLRERGLLES